MRSSSDSLAVMKSFLNRVKKFKCQNLNHPIFFGHLPFNKHEKESHGLLVVVRIFCLLDGQETLLSGAFLDLPQQRMHELLVAGKLHVGQQLVSGGVHR